MSGAPARVLALVIAAVALAWAAPARASSHCHEHSYVVGRHRCRSFAGGWSPPAVRWEAGPALLHFDLPPLSQTVVANGHTYDVSTPGGPVTATAARWRTQFGYRGWYVGDEITFGASSDTPRVASNVAARGGPVDPSMIGTATAASMYFLVGKSFMAGDAFYGVEAAIGMHMVGLSPPNAMAAVAEVDFALEARARAGIFLTRWLSVSAVVGSDVIHREDYSVGLSLGFHLFPFDGMK